MGVIDLERFRQRIAKTELLVVQGKVIRASGWVVEAQLPGVAVGTLCDIINPNQAVVQAEVVGFSGVTALLMPLGEISGVSEGSTVVPRPNDSALHVGDALLGRVVNANLEPIDGGPALVLPEKATLKASPPRAMTRRRISQPLSTGVKAVDSCLVLGEGQRICVAAGPGVGKSVLLGMMAKHSDAEVCVVALIGERGREVREFVERDLGEQGLKNAVVVVATSDESPLVRVRAAHTATAVAEHWRKQGKKVVLLMDSLSRVAMALREIGLAAGEPPTSKGYPPSVFAQLPRLVERAGNDEGQGSITALYTVLAEGDDLSDPVVDCARAALDGHWVLSRKLASAGHFPAIDVLASVSRVMTDVAQRKDIELATSARDVLASYREAQDLIEVGAYVSGTNPRVDRALRVIQPLRSFLQQHPDVKVERDTTLTQLKSILDGGARS
ncbi:MAG: FliI/YscN family ATPase [Archangiaceae bacterium]|nr:FliI/YscN family ATPase [Archangiaceae bacterium]